MDPREIARVLSTQGEQHAQSIGVKHQGPEGRPSQRAIIGWILSLTAVLQPNCGRWSDMPNKKIRPMTQLYAAPAQAMA